MASTVGYRFLVPVTIITFGITEEPGTADLCDSHSTFSCTGACEGTCAEGKTGRAIVAGPVSSEPLSSLSTPAYRPHGNIIWPEGESSH